MAFGYKADYGYYDGPIINGQTNISDLTITDSDKWFVVAETTTSPRIHSQVDQDIIDAHEYAQSIVEYAGVTLLPYNMFYTSTPPSPAPNTVQAIIDLIPSAFRECPNLLAHEMVVTNPVDNSHTSFVYLKEVGKLIQQNSIVFNVASDGTLVNAQVSAVFFLRVGSFSGPLPYDSQCDFYFMAQNEELAYKCGVRCTGGTRKYSVYNSAEIYNAETWDRLKKDVFGSGDPEWTRNPFDTDPYNPVNPGGGGPSKPGGGGGSYNFDPENIVPITDPDDLVNLTNTDLISVYSPTNSQLAELATYLWDDSFFQSLIKIKNDPFDVIIGLHIVPVPLSGSSHTVKLGNVTTTIQMKKVSSQFYKKSCGGIMLDEIWGAYLDYMCRIQLFLPFIGFVSISPDDVFGHIISVDYIVDAITGGCVAFIRRDNECIATYGGNCAYQIPLTGANYANISSAIIGAVVTGVGAVAGVATGGLAAPLAATAIAGASINTATAKPEYQRSGALTANIGYMGMRTPYLLIYAPNQCVPEMQNAIKGYPAWITRSLGAVHGYTEVDTVHLDGITATDAEKEDIMAKLKAGVIL